MPDEELWRSFFEPDELLRRLELDSSSGDVVDLGCGYGTFAIPAAQVVTGVVHAVDEDPGMIAVTRRYAQDKGLTNVQVHRQDIIAQGTGLAAASVDYAMVFNILHGDAPHVLLCEALRVLRPGGKVGILHWRCDPHTPRGPSIAIRPKPEQCQQWATEVGFAVHQPYLDLPPYHYGMVGTKPAG
jgi:SAM-dependent methyltransferase